MFQPLEFLQVFCGDVRMVMPSCAVKVAMPGNEGALFNEFRIASSISPHPNVLRPYGVAKDDLLQQATHLAYPMCWGGDLHTLLSQFSEAQPMPRQLALSLLYQLLLGVLHIHDHGFVHRDLKPENIFLADSACTVAMLADMGLSARAGTLMYQLTGTLGYAPPEACLFGMSPVAAVTGVPSLPSFDTWSIGTIAAQLLTGCSVPAVIMMLQQNQLRDLLLEQVDEDLATGICRSLTVAAADRIALPTLRDLTLRALCASHTAPLHLPSPSLAPGRSLDESLQSSSSSESIGVTFFQQLRNDDLWAAVPAIVPFFS